MIFLVITDCVGGILRFIFSGPNILDYWFVFAGQGIMSLGQLITWAGPTKLSMIWFPDTERTLATSLGSMSNLLGIASAYLFCPYLVPDDKPDNVKQMLMIQMIVTVVLGVLALIFFRATPPSVSYPTLSHMFTHTHTHTHARAHTHTQEETLTTFPHIVGPIKVFHFEPVEFR